MGGSPSKAAAAPAAAAVADTSVEASKDAHMDNYAKYQEFRDQLLSFALGESAFDYAEQLFAKNPDSPEVMALLAETCALYDETKNKVSREHWCDRLDLLQRGVDVSRKCFNEHPEFGPCYRTYVICATRESEALYYFKSLEGLGLLENYNAIMKRGLKGMQLMPDDAELPNALAALNARSAYKWHDPTRWYARWYGVPPEREALRKSIELSLVATKNDPQNLEYAARLAMSYFQAGDFANSRRWFVRVRDDMPPQTLRDERWQGLAHTQLSTSFTKSKWNVPFA